MAKTNFIEQPLFDKGEPGKRCKECGEWKPLEEFNLRSCSDGRRSGHREHTCKKCRNARIYKLVKDNPERHERHKASVRRYHHRNPEKRRAKSLEWNYGLTQSEYDAMEIAQNGGCAICGKPETRTWKGKVLPLCVDHDHKTGKVRQLLCHKHNVMIGRADDDPSILEAGAAYLRKHGEKPDG